MANQDAAFGLSPLKMLGQADDSTGMSSHKILPGDASVLYQGSMAIGVATGYVDISGLTDVLNLGAFWGCFYVDPTTLKPTFKNYYPGSITPPSSKNIEAFVYDSPYQMFEIQSAGSGASDQSDVFSTCDLDSNGGRTRDGMSTAECADSYAAGPAVLKVIGVSRDPKNNDITAANVNWRVQICMHILGSGSIGV